MTYQTSYLVRFQTFRVGPIQGKIDPGCGYSKKDILDVVAVSGLQYPQAVDMDGSRSLFNLRGLQSKVHIGLLAARPLPERGPMYLSDK